jgi:beta-glucosidase
MGLEAKARDQDVVLGPGLNLVRVPHNGRNFEYLSEDPVHNAAFAAGVVEGLQAEETVATPKHYVANNQETGRATVSAEVDERTLRELYLPGFRAAVDAGAGAVMSSYNRVNGTWVSEHERLLTDVLKDDLGFDGFVMSDWFGTGDTEPVANAGLDLQMPGISMREMMSEMGVPAGEDGDGDGGRPDEDDDHPDDAGMEMDEEIADGMPDPERGTLFRDELAAAVGSGAVPEERLDDMVARQLRQLDRVGVLDGSRGDGELDPEAGADLAREIAVRGTVLLDNDGVLPLADDAHVALIGPNVDETLLGGGGSSELEPFDEVAPAEALADRAANVTVAHGHPRIEDVDFFGAMTGAGADDDADGGDEPTVEEAVAAAREADVAVVCLRDRATEAADRETLALPGDQDDLVRAIAEVAPTVAVLNTSGPVETPWHEAVDAVLEGWYPGQTHGDALADVLYGTDPGGRLPTTFAPEADYPAADPERFPGEDDRARYDEGVFVGYRHFDAAGIEPTYAFGHGESYAAFEYDDAEAVDESTVAVEVENVADRAGREVVQTYVSPPAVEGVDRPVREFAGAAAIRLDPGERRRVTIELDGLPFRRWAGGTDGEWTVDSGEYGVAVGRSSRDLRAEVVVER